MVHYLTGGDNIYDGISFARIEAERNMLSHNKEYDKVKSIFKKQDNKNSLLNKRIDNTILTRDEDDILTLSFLGKAYKREAEDRTWISKPWLYRCLNLDVIRLKSNGIMRYYQQQLIVADLKDEL